MVCPMLCSSAWCGMSGWSLHSCTENCLDDNHQSVGTSLPLLETRFYFLFYMFTYYRFFLLQEACISVQKKLNEGSEVYLKNNFTFQLFH